MSKFPSQWTPVLEEVADEVATFEELADVACRVLALQAAFGPVYQVCGPISTGGAGSVEKNREVFKFTVELLRQRGLNMFDQLPLERTMGRLAKSMQGNGYCMPILEVVYGSIFSSGHVRGGFFLPYWFTSFGNRWERRLLTTLNIEIFEVPRQFLLPVWPFSSKELR